MDVSIKIEGLEDMKKMMDDMINDLEPESFAKWAKRIEKTAKEICNDPDCKRLSFKPEKGKETISISVKDKEAIDCIKKSIEQHLNSMTLGLKAFYQQSIPKILKNLENQLDEKVEK